MQSKKNINLKFSTPADMGVLEPSARLKALSNFSSSVDIDPNVPARRYYRSGLEMVRMANVYMDEGSLENAYVLYMKFMTLFIEKIRKHPDFASVPVNMKSINSNKLKEVLTRAEKLKLLLLQNYTIEYEKFVVEQKRREKELQLRKIAEVNILENKNDKQIDGKGVHDYTWPKVEPVPTINEISYPDEDESKSKIKQESREENKEVGKIIVPQKPNKLDVPSPVYPSVDRSTKPLSLLSPSAQNKAGNRNIIVPSNLMNKFLMLAQKNTFNKIETCGVLAGKLERDQLIITHVIVSKQEGTSDTCNTKNEEEIFDFQDQHSLITLGWIHTHPTQTAFLSSIDLHTQCSYQIMMPEAIAIVCAPKYNQTGFYVLTLYGLELISQCQATGFHPHPTETCLFKTAEHMKIESSSSACIVDLR